MTSLALFLSLLFFGSDVASMGSDSFAVRQRASFRAELLAPLNHVALTRGLHSPDPEIRWRCRDALVVSRRRLEPFVVGWTYVRAFQMIYGPGEWYLSREQELDVLGGGYALHHALYVVAKAGGVLTRYGYAATAPCETIERQFGNNLPVVGYRPAEMVGFAHIMRRRLRGMQDEP